MLLEGNLYEDLAKQGNHRDWLIKQKKMNSAIF